MPKCKGCGKKCEPSGVVTLCSYECARIVAEKADKKVKREKVRKAKAVKKAFNDRTKVLKKAAARRTGKDGLYKVLQSEVNWHVKHVKEKGRPCCTCGREQKHNDSPQAFHAGHCYPAGTVDTRRFELTNLHIQCYECNTVYSGRKELHRQYIGERYGADHLAWLDGPHPSLKEQFPTIDDIRAEIARYRKLNREAKADS